MSKSATQIAVQAPHRLYNFDQPRLDVKPLVVREASPQSEWLLSQQMVKLFAFVDAGCKKYFGIAGPRSAIIRWIFYMLREPCDPNGHPIFRLVGPTTMAAAISSFAAIWGREARAIIVPTYVPWESRKSLEKVVEAYVKFIERLTALTKDEPLLAARIEWADMAVPDMLGAAALYEALQNLRTKYDEVIILTTLKPIEIIATKVVEWIAALPPYAPSPLIEAASINVIEKRSDEMVEVWYKPSRSGLPPNNSSPAPDCCKISTDHYVKLQELYRLHAGLAKDAVFADKKAFKSALYSMLKRYQTVMFDGAACDTSSMHAAIPHRVFEHFAKTMGMRIELFASPLNCYFRQFCSAFPDTDWCFGSLGSFNECVGGLPSGVYACNPPYTEEVIDGAADLVLKTLADSETDGRSLVFFMVVPDWRLPLQPGQVKLEASPYLRSMIDLDKGEYQFVSGEQQLLKRAKRYHGFPCRMKWIDLRNELAIAPDTMSHPIPALFHKA